MCSFHGCCDSGIHSERNTPNLRSGPDRSRHNKDLIFEGSMQSTVSEPREVTRLNARPDHRSNRHEHRSDRHEPRSDHRRDQHHGRRDNTLNTRSDSHMNSQSDNPVNARPSDTNLKNVHVVISGKVQGVYYRKWTVENATKLSLNGWVRNCKDGTVEAVFSGKPNAVDHMVNICKSGPSRARVANVEVTTAAGPPKKGFEQLDDKRW